MHTPAVDYQIDTFDDLGTSCIYRRNSLCKSRCKPRNTKESVEYWLPTLTVDKPKSEPDLSAIQVNWVHLDQVRYVTSPILFIGYKFRKCM